MSVTSAIDEMMGRLGTLSQTALNTIRQASSSGSTEDLLLAQDAHFTYMNAVGLISAMRKADYDLTQGILNKLS